MQTVNDRLIEFKQELSALLTKHKAEISLNQSDYGESIQIELLSFFDENGNYNEYIREDIGSWINEDKLK